MTEFVVAGPPAALTLGRLRDLVALGKPRLSVLVLFTTAIGVWLAPSQPGTATTVTFLLATSALVASANALNCWLEREGDRLMTRTCRRPLPAGRLEPRTGLIYGVSLGVGALAVIAATTNGLTVALGAAALLVYVLVYTPLKRITPWAVVVGAVPGALPPLMGWTAATGTIGAPGAFLFGILFLWQLPHFIAISQYLADDFRRAGIRALPVVSGERTAGAWLAASVVALTGFSLLALPMGLAGPLYAALALALGLPWIVLATSALRGPSPASWGRRLFGFSLLYLPLLVSLLVLDRA